jgi:hypothetical protein
LIKLRKDFVEICAKTEAEIDVKVLMQAVHTTIEFEEKLEKRFPTKVILILNLTA